MNKLNKVSQLIQIVKYIKNLEDDYIISKEEFNELVLLKKIIDNKIIKELLNKDFKKELV